jgi:threonine/homoserine/homoserine lactone efflux protein
VDPQTHLGWISFGVMAATIAALTFLYGLGMSLLTHYLAERMRANPVVGRVLEKVAGLFLVGFGLKLALSK